MKFATKRQDSAGTIELCMRRILVTNVTQYTGPGIVDVLRREAGGVVAFLASGRSPFTTGQVVYFSGGWP